MLTLQYAAGIFAYLWPKLPLARRQALGPLHRFVGQAVFVGGIATMAVRWQPWGWVACGPRQQQCC